MSLERKCWHEAVYLKSEALSRVCIPAFATPSLLCLSPSPWPLNCFLEAGDFGRGDKEEGMKHSGCLSISVFLCEAGEVQSSRDHGGSSHLAPISRDEATLPAKFHTSSSRHRPYQRLNKCSVIGSRWCCTVEIQ